MKWLRARTLLKGEASDPPWARYCRWTRPLSPHTHPRFRRGFRRSSTDALRRAGMSVIPAQGCCGTTWKSCALQPARLKSRTDIPGSAEPSYPGPWRGCLLSFFRSCIWGSMAPRSITMALYLRRSRRDWPSSAAEVS